MRLTHMRTPRSSIPAIPLANLALLVWTSVMVSGMYAAARGPALRFASVDRDGAFDEASAVRVAVFSESEATVEGEPVSIGELGELVAKHLEGREHGAVLLTVSPDATYESMVTAYAAIAGLPGPPRIAFPESAPELGE